MSLKKTLGKLFVLSMLEFGALAGVPMTPEDIEKLMQIMNRTKVVRVEKNENGDGDDENQPRAATMGAMTKKQIAAKPNSVN